MITYELAKELKDAGFPKLQGWNGLTWFFADESIRNYIPTLSELIEACGEEFYGLNRQNYVGYVGMWGAFSRSSLDAIVGSTPEEAVARLWLELNKK